MMLEVCVDDREKKSRQQKALELFDNAHVERLPAGDYTCGEVAVEYKTDSDMVASIVDYRVFNECSRISQLYHYPYLVIAGNVPRHIEMMHQYNLSGRITLESYLGAIASLSTIVNVLVVNNQSQALHLIKSIFEKCNNSDSVVRGVVKPPRKTFNPAANYISLIRNIGTDTALKITEDLEVETLEDLLDLDIEKLLSVDGVGKKTAIQIMDKIKGER